jgi:hypothetical protein
MLHVSQLKLHSSAAPSARAEVAKEEKASDSWPALNQMHLEKYALTFGPAAAGTRLKIECWAILRPRSCKTRQEVVHVLHSMQEVLNPSEINSKIDGSEVRDDTRQLLHKDELRPGGYGHVSTVESNTVDRVGFVDSKHIS